MQSDKSDSGTLWEQLGELEENPFLMASSLTKITPVRGTGRKEVMISDACFMLILSSCMPHGAIRGPLGGVVKGTAPVTRGSPMNIMCFVPLFCLLSSAVQPIR